ncbi:MAG: hypothetical protein SWK76_02230, partial [Actinomycetota bacterium]|nr:hypothetical protein [Actinomycetota bacterium]
SVPPLSRYTLNVADVVGEGRDVSMVVESDTPVVAERPMYFNYHGMRAGGHDSPGVTSPSERWYFAEGCTRSGFDTWLCVANPGDDTALLDVFFLTPEGEESAISESVPPLSRYTLNVADVVGEGRDVSMVVESDTPVVAERPMYFDCRSQASPTAYDLAQSSGLTLIGPVSYQETVGIMYHEASRRDIHNREAHARLLVPLGGCVEDDNPGARYPEWIPAREGDPYYWVQESRGRGTWSTTAVDVGAKAGCAVLCPVDGMVESVEAYNLYGVYPDQRVAIIPDGQPGLRVILLHIMTDGLEAGDRLVAGETTLGTVRALSAWFRSDIGVQYTGDEGDHVHMQINLAPDE